MKKRTMLTIEQEPYKKLIALGKEMKMPTSIVSDICNDVILQTLELLEKAKKKGSLSVTDLLMQVAEHIDKDEREEKESAESTPKTKEVVKRVKKKAA